LDKVKNRSSNKREWRDDREWPLGRGGSIDGVYIKKNFKKIDWLKGCVLGKKELSRDRVDMPSGYFELGN
jgi:hypothetical protein